MGEPQNKENRLYAIFPGNGYEDLKRAMSKKKNWVEIPATDAFTRRCNFVWKPVNFNNQQYRSIDRLQH